MLETLLDFTDVIQTDIDDVIGQLPVCVGTTLTKDQMIQRYESGFDTILFMLEQLQNKIETEKQNVQWQMKQIPLYTER